jgi:PAS domain-containing protein
MLDGDWSSDVCSSDLNPSMVEMGKSKLEQYGVTKDGCTIPLEIGLSVIETETGILIASSLRDISERKKSEQQIRDSETRLALAAEAGGLGMWEWRIEEDSFYMSDYWRKIKCLPDGVVSYNWQRWEEGIAQEDRTKVKETLQLHLDGKSERFEAEYRFYRTHDDWYWEHVSGRIIERGADGKPIRMVGYVHDITSRKIVEETLNHERERLQQILDTSPMYVGIVCDGIFRFANHRLFLRFGITTGDREETLFVDRDQYEHLTVERSVKQVIRNRELQLYNKTGEIRDMLASFLATSFEGRDASLCWLIDVTTLKETERELRNKVDELARFRKLAVGREQRMMELKQEINTALASKNIPPKYSVH